MTLTLTPLMIGLVLLIVGVSIVYLIFKINPLCTIAAYYCYIIIVLISSAIAGTGILLVVGASITAGEKNLKQELGEWHSLYTQLSDLHSYKLKLFTIEQFTRNHNPQTLVLSIKNLKLVGRQFGNSGQHHDAAMDILKPYTEFSVIKKELP